MDVSFMVGENSTGKTSLLKMLKMMSTPELLMGVSAFGRPGEVLFGHFNEMVSIHAEDRSYFRFGSIDELSDGPRPRNIPLARAMLITYKEKDGMPKVSRFTFSQAQAEVSLKFEGDKVLVKVTEQEQNATVESLRISLQRWNIEHSRELLGWQELQLPKGFPPGPIPIYMALHYASASSNKLGPLFYGEDNQFVFIAPIRTQPRRTYDEPNTPFSSEGDHIPYVIRRLSTSADSDKFTAFMKHVGKSSGLFETVGFRRHGNSSDAPFEVDAILDGKAVNLSWMGYGVSQSLPILVELFDRKGDCTFAIQQPEVHLHPRAQAALGDLFFDVASRGRTTLIIETHSDFMIDRFRLNYRKNYGKKKKPNLPNSQVLFFERRSSQNTVTPLLIGDDGNLPPDQPRGYRDFFVKEETSLLEL
jgi:AAA ATPase domain